MKDFKIFYQKNKEVIHYLIVGVLTTVVSLLTYYLCVSTILNPNHAFELQLANIISWIVSVLFAYYTNRKYVFESKNTNTKKEFFSFVLSRVFTLLLDMGIMFLGVTVLKFNDKLIKIVSQVVVIVLNYVLSKLFVFQKK